MDLPKRKELARHEPREKFGRSTIVFVTMCTHKRRSLLANRAAQEEIVKAWTEADLWIVGRYVLMPDHIHFFVSPNSNEGCSLDRWIKFWRNTCTRKWPEEIEKPLWQRDYWDKQLRVGESYSQKWQYVLDNPVRKGLVAEAEDWPYQGELNVLPWIDVR